LLLYIYLFNIKSYTKYKNTVITSTYCQMFGSNMIGIIPAVWSYLALWLWSYDLKIALWREIR